MRHTNLITPEPAGAVPAVRVPAVSLPVPIRAVLTGTALLAAVLLAGCASSAPAPPRATPGSCYAFAVHALGRHVTVTAIPPACAGLSNAQVNGAVDRAIRNSVAALPKAAARAKAVGESRYLAGLIRPVPAPPPAPFQPGPPSPPASSQPANLAALAAWIATALAGGYLLAGRLGRRRPRRRRWSAGNTPPLVIAGHACLGVAGLAVWIAFLVTGTTALAWGAVGVTFVLAGLGMATLLTASGDTPPAGPDAGGPDAGGPDAGGPGPGRRPPVIVIALHGVLATVTILLVLLATIGAA